MTYTNVSNLGHAHQEWLKSLDFSKDEIIIMRKRLEEVISKNTGSEVTAEVEHYQNQFIVQQNNIDELKHTINEHTHLVFEDAKAHVGRVEETRVTEHGKIDDQVKMFEKSFTELRKEYNKFLAKWF